MQTYLSDAIIADGKQLLQTMHALYDAQPKDGATSTMVDEQTLDITLVPEVNMWLYRATEMNDISYFHTCERGEKPAEERLEHIRDIWQCVIVPKTNPLQTIWRTYLLGKAKTQLPANWHGAYNKATLIFEASDMESIQPMDRVIDHNVHHSEMPAEVFANRDWRVIASIEELQPKVITLDESTYQVVCCYWNDWEGLVRETTTYITVGRLIYTEDSKKEVLYPYHCGVMF